jgi:alkanesulfonate monooxygenase SsuD/methylene tetrahydromethanopterin reductase-like flavin-dependent oxidoreductase (luciferase family)
LSATARRFESAGVDMLWTGDYFQSGLVRAAAIGAATTRVDVGTHVLQAFARSPLATALAAQELQALTGGRFVLGLGSQVPAANRRWHGVELAKPVAALTDYLAGLRALFTTPGDEPCSYHGPYFAFEVPPFRTPTAARPPVWIGGAGDATIRLAAQAADGLAGHLLWSNEYVAAHVRPALEGTDLSVTVARLAAPTGGARLDLARRLAHYLVTPAYQPMLRRQGIDLDRETLLAAVRADDEEAMLRAVEPCLGRYCVMDAYELRAQLDEAARCGISGIALFVPADPRRPERTERYEAELADLITDLRRPSGRGADTC